MAVSKSYRLKILNKLELEIDFDYDKKSEEFLVDQETGKGYQDYFERQIVSLFKAVYSDNPDLIDSKKKEILFELRISPRQFHLQCEPGDGTSFGVKMNPEALKNLGFDIFRYCKYKVPLEKWFIFRKWYGKTLNFYGVIHHEIRHSVDQKIEELLKVKKAFEDKEMLNYRIVEVMDGLAKIRSEAYPKLFDTEREVTFFHDKLFQIKFNILKFAKGLPKSPQYVDPKEPLGFLGSVRAGDVHYYLAKYMALVIAYSLMEPDSLINERHGLRVRDLNKAIEKGLPVKQPPLKIKRLAGEIIKKSKPLVFVKEFEKAAKKIGLAEGNIPLTMKMIEKLILEYKKLRQKIVKHNLDYVFGWWRKKVARGKATFYELKRKVEEEIAKIKEEQEVKEELKAA